MIKIAGILTIQGFQRFFTNVHQKCPFCRQNTLVKNGRKNGKQRYKCSACNKYLPQAQRLNNKQLLYEYIHLKQTYVQIAQRYRCHPKTVCRRIRSMHPAAVQTLPETACIIMDTRLNGHLG